MKASHKKWEQTKRKPRDRKEYFKEYRQRKKEELE
jgi:hypothetical protein